MLDIKQFISDTIPKIEPFRSADVEFSKHMTEFLLEKLEEESVENISDITEDFLMDALVEAETKNYVLPKHSSPDNIAADLFEEVEQINKATIKNAPAIDLNVVENVEETTVIFSSEQDSINLNDVEAFFDHENAQSNFNSLTPQPHDTLNATPKDINLKTTENDSKRDKKHLDDLPTEPTQSVSANTPKTPDIPLGLSMTPEDIKGIADSVKSEIIRYLSNSSTQNISEEVVTEIINSRLKPIMESYLFSANTQIKDSLAGIQNIIKALMNIQYIPQQFNENLLSIKHKFAAEGNKTIFNSLETMSNNISEMLDQRLDKGVVVKKELSRTQNIILISCALTSFLAVIISIICVFSLKDVYYGYNQYINIEKNIKSLSPDDQKRMLDMIYKTPINNN